MQTLAPPTGRDGQGSPTDARKDGPERSAPERAGSFHRWMNRRWPVDQPEERRTTR